VWFGRKRQASRDGRKCGGGGGGGVALLNATLFI